MTQLHAERYRLVTRSDFDGLVCAALLRQMDILGDVKFVHPKDVQDGKVELGPTDIDTHVNVGVSRLVYSEDSVVRRRWTRSRNEPGSSVSNATTNSWSSRPNE